MSMGNKRRLSLEVSLTPYEKIAAEDAAKELGLPQQVRIALVPSWKRRRAVEAAVRQSGAIARSR